MANDMNIMSRKSLIIVIGVLLVVLLPVVSLEIAIKSKIHSTINKYASEEYKPSLHAVDLIVYMGGYSGESRLRALREKLSDNSPREIEEALSIYEDGEVLDVLWNEKELEVNGVFREIYLSYLFYRNSLLNK